MNLNGSLAKPPVIPDLRELTSRRCGGPGAGPNSVALSSGPARLLKCMWRALPVLGEIPMPTNDEPERLKCIQYPLARPFAFTLRNCTTRHDSRDRLKYLNDPMTVVIEPI